jgi:hypothetical protein
VANADQGIVFVAVPKDVANSSESRNDRAVNFSYFVQPAMTVFCRQSHALILEHDLAKTQD